ncbi:beta strand repeat-containing protein, partial [Candidatus Aquicultor sp.]
MQLVIGTNTAPANIGGLYLTNSSTFGKALAILNQTESQDIFTASASGVTKFVITNAGKLKIIDGTQAAGYVLTTDATGLASWTDVSGSAGPWTLSGNNLYPDSTSYNVAVGAADAGTAKLYVNGNVGIGTTAPTVQLHVYRSGANADAKIETSSGTNVAKLSFSNQDRVWSTGVRGEISDGFSIYSESYGASRLFIDGTTTGNVGIGTTSPEDKLHVAGGNILLNNTYGLQIKDGGGTARTILTVNGSSNATLYGPNDLYVKGQNNVYFQYGGGTVMTINSSGNVGIGTTSPLALLDVAGAATIGGQLTFDAGNTIQTTAMNTLTLGGSTTGNIVLNPANAVAGGAILPNTNNVTDIGSSSLQFRNIYATNFIGGSSGVQGLWQRTSGSLAPTNITDSLNLGAIATSSALVHLAGTSGENSWINTGNVGIGTTSPSIGDIATGIAKLHISDTGSAGSFYPVARFQAGNDSDNTGAAIVINHNNDRGLMIKAGRDINDTAIAHLSMITNAAGNVSDVITMKGNGNVGIGITAPGATLEVAGTLEVDNAASGVIASLKGGADDTAYEWVGYYSGETRQGIMLWDGSWSGAGNRTNEFSLTAENSNWLTLRSDIGTSILGGNVGIGTTSPGEKLDIAGGSILLDSLQFLKFGTGLSYVSEYETNKLRMGGYSGVDIYAAVSTADFTFTNNQTPNLFIIKGTGNVGIGTTSPLALLDVAGAATIGGQLTFDAGNTIQTTAMNTLTLGGSTTGNIVLNPANAAAGGAILPNTNNVTDIGSSSLQFRNIYASNFIGGTSGVQGLWQRNSSALSPTNITDDLLLGATATSSALVKLTGTAGNNSWINTGNVGIGTTSPGSKLVVTGGGSRFGDATDGLALSYTSGFGLIYGLDIGGSGYNGIQFMTSATPAVTILTSGNVGIGTTNPTSSLTVNGAITIQSPTSSTHDSLLSTGAVSPNDILYIDSKGGTGGWTGAIQFRTSYNNGALSPIMSIGMGNQGGNVGIGTTSPLALLDVAGAATIGGQLTFDAGNTIQTTAM